MTRCSTGKAAATDGALGELFAEPERSGMTGDTAALGEHLVAFEAHLTKVTTAIAQPRASGPGMHTYPENPAATGASPYG